MCLGLLASQVAAGNAGRELPLRFVGAFTNFRETGEHVYGYELELWRRSDRTLTGLLGEATGQPADFPTTRLDQVEFEDGTGRLRFTAPWCDQRLIFDGRIDGDHRCRRLQSPARMYSSGFTDDGKAVRTSASAGA